MSASSKSWLALPFAAALLSFGMQMPAQAATQRGLVNVDLSNADILSNIANDLHVDVRQVPVTVQAPISVAANVCDVAVNVLAQTLRRGNTSCTAQSTSTALERIVQRYINNQP